MREIFRLRLLCIFNRLLRQLIAFSLSCVFCIAHSYAYMSAGSLEDLLGKNDPKLILTEIEKHKTDLSPTDYLILKSDAYLLMRNWKEGIDILLPLYTSDPRNPLIANNYAVALWGLGKKDQAKLVLEKNLELNSPVFRNLRKIYLNNAADAYSRALDGKPNPVGIDLLLSAKTGLDIVVRPTAPVQQVDKVNRDDSSIKNEKPKEALDKNIAVKEDKSNTPIEKTDEKKLEPKDNQNKDKSNKDKLPAEYVTIDANIHGWASSWSSKNIKSYLSFYSTNFNPEKGVSYSEWVNQRTQRVTKPGPINIQIDIISYSRSEKKITVKIHQKYSSTNLSSDLVKYLEFTNEQGKWLITREFNR